MRFDFPGYVMAATLLLGLSVVAQAADGPSAAAKPAATAAPVQPAAPKLSGLKARIGGGGSVNLAASRYSSAELAAMRPGYEKLKPTAHTNAQ